MWDMIFDVSHWQSLSLALHGFALRDGSLSARSTAARVVYRELIGSWRLQSFQKTYSYLESVLLASKGCDSSLNYTGRRM